MTRALSAEEARRLRLHAQRLDGKAATVSAAVEAACGLQAQEKPAAFLSVRARTTGLVTADVERALYAERSVVRTWCMRGTLHLVAAADLSWLLSLFGPHFASRGPEPKQFVTVGPEGSGIERALEHIERVLGDEGPLTRDELADRLRAAGVDVDTNRQVPYFLVRRAALRGDVCEVAPKGGRNAYDLLEAWVPLAEPPAREEALVALARRYLTAFGPATLTDFAHWSGLGKRDARAGWEAITDEVVAVEVEGQPAGAMLAEAGGATESMVRLLPGYDTYLLGYHPDGRPVAPEHRARVWPGGGVIRPTALVDGEVVGTWKLDRTGGAVRVEAFDDRAADATASLEAEVADIGRFLGRDDLTLSVE